MSLEEVYKLKEDLLLACYYQYVLKKNESLVPKVEQAFQALKEAMGEEQAVWYFKYCQDVCQTQKEQKERFAGQ